ncbi:hypothetical protein PoB_001057500 [Plakobranchus ocellatus]|uniref:Uncharacterized protein n=1 Tax=Plakobranchus ocellatus TaxID=259542 RepID=A0AAV3YNL7_9GAST|nr:hypothetical protein PoB_001057500 [Plakobranchus ocellatus]
MNIINKVLKLSPDNLRSVSLAEESDMQKAYSTPAEIIRLDGTAGTFRTEKHDRSAGYQRKCDLSSVRCRSCTNIWCFNGTVTLDLNVIMLVSSCMSSCRDAMIHENKYPGRGLRAAGSVTSLLLTSFDQCRKKSQGDKDLTR